MERANREETTEEARVVTVGGLEILEGNLEATVELIGTTAPKEMVNVMVGIPAEVATVAVAVGDYVQEGALLFTMDAESVEKQVTQAEIALNMAEVGVANAKAAVNQASLAYTMAEANHTMQLESFNFGQENLANYEALLAEGLVSQMEYDQVKLQSSEETLKVLQAQRSQAAAALSQSKLGVENAEASLRQAKEGLETAKDALADTRVTAPVSGFITASYVTVNNMVAGTSPAMVIQNMDSITISASVTESLVTKLAIGDQVMVTINALEGEAFEGEIKTLSTGADQRTLLFPLTVEVANTDHRIKPGMFATIDVVKAARQDALYVPSEAIVLRDDHHYLYVMDGTDKAVRRPVTTGIDNGYFTEIVTGAEKGDIIVTTGIGLIDENSTVKLIRGDQP